MCFKTKIRIPQFILVKCCFVLARTLKVLTMSGTKMKDIIGLVQKVFPDFFFFENKIQNMILSRTCLQWHKILETLYFDFWQLVLWASLLIYVFLAGMNQKICEDVPSLRFDINYAFLKTLWQNYTHVLLSWAISLKYIKIENITLRKMLLNINKNIEKKTNRTICVILYLKTSY